MSRRRSPSTPRGRTASRAAAPPARAKTSWRSPGIELVLVALCAILYFQTRTFQFIDYDDPDYVTKNAVVLSGLSWHSLGQAFTTLTSPYWHPVTWITHLLDISMFGPNPGPPHLVNAAFHIGTTLLVFWMLRRMTRLSGASAVVAAIFAVHPVHVESVAWITERKDVLSSFLLLLSLGAYLRYVDRPSRSRYAVLAGAFGLALMAKPMVVTFPVLLLLLDYWPLGRLGSSADRAAVPWRTLIVEKVPLAVMAVIVGLVTIRLQTIVGAVPTLQTLPIASRIANAITSYPAYLGEILWPWPLAAFYPLHVISAAAIVGSSVALVTFSWATLQWRRALPYLFVGWWWFVVMLAPVVAVQAGEQIRADRHLYLAMLGILLIVVWGARDLLARLDAPAPASPIASTAVVAILVPLGVTQVATWHDSVTLWGHAAAVTTGNYKAYELRGEAERDLGQYDAAKADYQRALANALPNSPLYVSAIHNDLGLVAARAQRPEEAVAEFRTALATNPQFSVANVNLANALATLGQLSEAGDRFASAIAADPKSVEARVGLGNVLLQQDHAAEAIASFRAAISLEPDQADAHNGLGAALTETGHPADAIPELSDALRIRPQFPNAEVNLAMAFLKLGRVDDARQHAEAALALAPGLPAARQVLASLPIKQR